MLQMTFQEMKTNEKKRFTVGAGYTVLATGLIATFNFAPQPGGINSTDLVNLQKDHKDVV